MVSFKFILALFRSLFLSKHRELEYVTSYCARKTAESLQDGTRIKWIGS